LQALLPNLGVLWVSYLKSGMGDARGTYINRNHFAGFMEMLLPLLLGFSLSRVRWGGRLKWKALLHSDHLHQHVLMVLGLVVMTLALLFSKSRGGITGALLGMFVFFMFLRGGARQMPKGVWVLCGLFFGLILFYGLRIGFDPIFDRFLALEQGNSRLDYWRDSLPIIAAHPLGIGLAAFETVFPIYDTSTVSDRSMAVYLHNDVLQLLVEAGWIGFLALAGAFTLFMVKMFRRIRCMDAACDPQRFFLAAGAYGGLTAMTVHSFFDFNLQIPANAVYFVMLMAMVKVLSAQSYSQTMGGAERVATGAACGR
jgi:O-antigen ligase